MFYSCLLSNRYIPVAQTQFDNGSNEKIEGCRGNVSLVKIEALGTYPCIYQHRWPAIISIKPKHRRKKIARYGKPMNPCSGRDYLTAYHTDSFDV